MKIFLIFGMKRSGQHAIINWLCRQNAPSIHYNACKIINDKIKTNRYVYCYYKNGHIKKFNSCDKFICYNKFIDYGDIYFTHFFTKKANLLVYNFEGQYIKNIIDNTTNICIIRDPFNMIASYLKVKGKNRFDKNIIDIWKSHVKDKNTFKIIYNKWFLDKDYRENICEILNIPFNDNGLNDVIFNGRSSFDKFKYNNEAQNMDVLERWKYFENDNFFNNLIDNELISLSEEHFNFNPFKEETWKDLK